MEHVVELETYARTKPQITLNSSILSWSVYTRYVVETYTRTKPQITLSIHPFLEFPYTIPGTSPELKQVLQREIEYILQHCNMQGQLSSRCYGGRMFTTLRGDYF